MRNCWVLEVVVGVGPVVGDVPKCGTGTLISGIVVGVYLHVKHVHIQDPDVQLLVYQGHSTSCPQDKFEGILLFLYYSKIIYRF